MIGPPAWGTCSFVHYIEEETRVPYRFWKTFKGWYRRPENGAVVQRSFKFFARQLKPFEWDTDLSPVGALLKAIEMPLAQESNAWKNTTTVHDECNDLVPRTALREAPLGDGHILAFAWNDLRPALAAALVRNPYLLARPAASALRSWMQTLPVNQRGVVLDGCFECSSGFDQQGDSLTPSKGGLQDAAMVALIEATVRELLPNAVSVGAHTDLFTVGLTSSTFLEVVSVLSERLRVDLMLTARSAGEPLLTLTTVAGIARVASSGINYNENPLPALGSSTTGACARKCLVNSSNRCARGGLETTFNGAFFAAEVRRARSAVASINRSAAALESNANVSLESARIAFIGRGRPMRDTLRALLDSGLAVSGRLRVVRVYTGPNEVTVRHLAMALGAELLSDSRLATPTDEPRTSPVCFEPRSDIKANASAATGRATASAADWLLSINNTRILPDAFLRMHPRGCLNIHPGRLPEYAGLHVAQWAIRNGDVVSSATLHWMTAEVDAGEIALRSAPVRIEDDDTGLSLLDKCQTAGVGVVLQAVAHIVEGLDLPRVPQDTSLFHLYRSADARDGTMLWSEQTAKQMVDFVRAADYGGLPCPTYTPGFRTRVSKHWFDVMPGGVERPGLRVDPAETPAGTVVAVGSSGLLVACADGECVLLTAVVDRGLDGTSPRGQTISGGALSSFLRACPGRSLV
jgi:methionyl-tRNA formyltransferase